MTGAHLPHDVGGFRVAAFTQYEDVPTLLRAIADSAYAPSAQHIGLERDGLTGYSAMVIFDRVDAGRMLAGTRGRTDARDA